MSEDLKTYVENRIISYTFHAKNFTIEDMQRVDDYCKKYFGNDRRKMILTLITQQENNTALSALNDKIDLMAINLLNEIDIVKNDVDKVLKEKELNIEEKPKKVAWKGFQR